MSADNSEKESTANGNDPRSRYLPVSRKELRRRREEERRQAEAEQAQVEQTEVEAKSEDGAPDEPLEADQPTPESAEQVEGETVEAELAEADQAETEQVETEPDEAEHVEPEESDADALERAESEGLAPAADEVDEDESANQEPDAEQLDSVEVEDEPDAEIGQGILPAPLSDDQAPRPEEEIADAAAVEQTEAETTEEEPPAASGTLERPELLNPQSAASRRARRFLRETSGLPAMSPELIAEIESTTSEIRLHDDPDNVDPELLKKQQAIAEKALQANQERMWRKQREEAEAQQRKREQTPESEIITEKTVRETTFQDEFLYHEVTGKIEPVKAQGAHGLELDRMVSATSKHAERQHMLGWLVIVLTVLLVIAVGAALYFMVF